MIKILFLLLIFCNSLYSQPLSDLYSAEKKIKRFKSNPYEFLDENGNNILTSVGNDSMVFSGQAFNNYFGCSVSSAGDVNNDGFSDIIVGACYYSNGAGRAYIYLGGQTMDNVADLIISGSNTFGANVSSAGDINGDGYSDVFVSSGSSINIYYGGEYMNNQVDIILSGYGVQSGSASNAGDVNGDGYPDIIAGAQTGSASGSKVYIYFGGPLIIYGPDIIIEGGEATNSFGFDVSSAGDVNNDGFSDVIIGDDTRNCAFIFYGGNYINATANVTITGVSGRFVSNSGDLNGDGFSDVIVDNKNIYFGGLSMNNTVDLILSDISGWRSTFADVNWDGYSDAIVGDDFTRKVKVYYGGITMDDESDITLTSEFLDDRFGKSVSSAGDINTDGYEDLIVGSEGFDSQRGRAYLYYNLMPKPELIYPAKNSINNSVDIIFKWKKINGASYYKLNIAKDSTFNNIVVNDSLTNDTSKNVTGLLRDTKYYWRVIAKDTFNVVHNSSEWSFTTVPPLLINIKLLFEGMYSSSFNQMIRKDTVVAYLRQSTSPYNLIDSAKSVIDSILFTGFFKFYFTPSGTYYLTVKHLNSIETWSKFSGENLINDGSIYNFDFTTAITQAYGNNLKLKGSKFCMYSGDVNQDGFVTLFDVIPIYNNASSFISGYYLKTDLTGDGIVDLTDVTICYNNSTSFIRLRHP